jgi:two-component system alkaline phosphatase synthesis response regulator PhoP
VPYLILVVDDDDKLRALYRVILEREGYTVDEAANGAEALKYLSSHTPHLIILDMLMPILGGEAVLRRIQQNPALSSVCLIVLTAYPRFRDALPPLFAGQFLVKPVTPEQIVSAVRAGLDGQSRPPG